MGIGFVDLVGSTAWSSHLTLEEHALALTAFETAAWDITTGHGGRVVKLIGDEVMFVAPSGLDADAHRPASCAARRRATRLSPRPGGQWDTASSGHATATTSARSSIWWPRAMQVAEPSTVVITEAVRAELQGVRASRQRSCPPGNCGASTSP